MIDTVTNIAHGRETEKTGRCVQSLKAISIDNLPSVLEPKVSVTLGYSTRYCHNCWIIIGAAEASAKIFHENVAKLLQNATMFVQGMSRIYIFKCLH